MHGAADPEPPPAEHFLTRAAVFRLLHMIEDSPIEEMQAFTA
jgi:hypothetical protein